jgi:hypothetical protein
MRTKLLLSAAALAAGLATSAMAQSNVYSLNVVGYYNIPVPANTFVLIANQLNTTNNTIGSVLANSPDGAQFQKYVGGFNVYIYDEFAPGWLPDGNATLNPGEGGFFKSPVATTLTFVGEVLQGSLTNTLPINSFALRSSIVPQAGLVTTTLGFPGEDGDQIQVYNNGFAVYLYDEFAPGWLPSEPNIAVGASFFSKKATTSVSSKWIRNFTVQ